MEASSPSPGPGSSPSPNPKPSPSPSPSPNRNQVALEAAYGPRSLARSECDGACSSWPFPAGRGAVSPPRSRSEREAQLALRLEAGAAAAEIGEIGAAPPDETADDTPPARDGPRDGQATSNYAATPGRGPASRDGVASGPRAAGAAAGAASDIGEIGEVEEEVGDGDSGSDCPTRATRGDTPPPQPHHRRRANPWTVTLSL